MQKFYLLALYATRRKTGHSLLKRKTDLVMLWAKGVIASSDEEAKQVGLALALEQCPLKYGWIDHYAVVNPVSRAALAKTVDLMSDEASSEDEPEWPDRIT